MTKDIGPQYKLDDLFKADARLYQSRYRDKVLKVDFQDYGNRLMEKDGRALLNYCEGLGVREVLRKRFPKYSKKRDADMLRSEHIPFNMFAPLTTRPDLTHLVLKEAFDLELHEPYVIRFEWAPSPSEKYLGDRTSFDTYIQGYNLNGEIVGIGIEVKYTEKAYKIRESEARRVCDRKSTYWLTTQESGQFVDGGCRQLAEDNLRQIWRNHLLGLSMVQHNDIEKFVSITLYPKGNIHFHNALEEYRRYLVTDVQQTVHGCTFEKYIDCLSGDKEIEKWKHYLKVRYLF